MSSTYLKAILKFGFEMAASGKATDVSVNVDVDGNGDIVNGVHVEPFVVYWS